MKITSVLVSALMGASALTAASAQAETIKIGLLAGISGPIAAMAPPMVEASRLAIQQVNEQGGIGKGLQLEAVVGDSACNAQAAIDAATKLVNIERVVGLVGPYCSGAVLAAANSVSIPAGVAMVSPSATSPEVTALEDKDTVFRTVPSDGDQGRVLASALLERGIKKVAVSYLNNDYGTGLAEAFKKEYEAKGGTIAGYAAHEDGKASYRSELAQLAQGADTLMIFDYGDGSGLTILRQALENGFFERYFGTDGMKSDSIIKELGAENLEAFKTSSPIGGKSSGLSAFKEAYAKTGGNPDSVFVTNAYDAAFVLALALEKAGGDPAKVPAALHEVAAAPGEPILPGEWSKAKRLIAEGKDIDYNGAAGNQEFDAKGDVPGDLYGLFKVGKDGYELEAEMK